MGALPAVKNTAALLTGLCCIWACSGCGLAGSSPEAKAPAKPMRVVSLDFCSDQYALKLLGKDRILALSPDAAADFSYMRLDAAGISTVRATAEDVLILEPDLIIRSYGGGPNAEAFFNRAGVPVITLGWAGDIEGIKSVMAETGDALGEGARAQAVIADITARLEAIDLDILNRNDDPASALYMTPTGVTTGEGSLIHEMLIAAGLENFQTQSGWRPLPLERLAYERPDIIAAAFFDSNVNKTDAWSSANHPIARAQMNTLPTVSLQGAWTSCGGWFLIDAIEALAAHNNVRHKVRGSDAL